MARESNKWDMITALSSLALALLALIALVFTYLQIMEFHHESQIQHLAEVVHEFDNGPVNREFNSLARKRVDQNTEVLKPLDKDEPPEEMYDISNFFEYVALLTQRGYLDQNDVWDSFGYYLFNFYADAKPMIDLEQHQDPDTYADLTWLVENMRQIEDKSHHGNEDHPTSDEIFLFYNGYVQSTGIPPAHGPRHKK
jgi:hypothetical protein